MGAPRPWLNRQARATEAAVRRAAASGARARTRELPPRRLSRPFVEDGRVGRAFRHDSARADARQREAPGGGRGGSRAQPRRHLGDQEGELARLGHAAGAPSMPPAFSPTHASAQTAHPRACGGLTRTGRTHPRAHDATLVHDAPGGRERTRHQHERAQHEHARERAIGRALHDVATATENGHPTGTPPHSPAFRARGAQAS